jgi:hypothetical protein
MGGRDCTEPAGAVVLLEPAEVSQETASGHAICYQEGRDVWVHKPQTHFFFKNQGDLRQAKRACHAPAWPCQSQLPAQAAD